MADGVGKIVERRKIASEKTEGFVIVRLMNGSWVIRGVVKDMGVSWGKSVDHQRANISGDKRFFI